MPEFFCYEQSRSCYQGLLSTKMNKILKENQEYFKMIENYDKIHSLPFHRKRIDFTLSVRTINKLKEMREKTGKPIPPIVEECVN